MNTELVNGNTLVFKVSDKGEIEDLNVEGEVVNFVADMLDVNSEVIHLIKNNLIKFGESIYKRTSKSNGNLKICTINNLPPHQHKWTSIGMSQRKTWK